MDLIFTLISCVREAQHATDKAAAELEAAKKKYQLDGAATAQVRNELFRAARETADAAKARGLEAIEKKCAELDAKEQRDGERRARDTDYTIRLESKLRIAQGLGEINDENRDRLKILFSEFTGDPLAVGLIRQTLGENKSLYFLPEDSTGKAQKHLKTAVKRLFERAMWIVGCNPASFGTTPEARAAEADFFCEYCNKQTDDFSRDDGAIWSMLYEKRKQDGAEDAPEMDMAFMQL